MHARTLNRLRRLTLVAIVVGSGALGLAVSAWSDDDGSTDTVVAGDPSASGSSSGAELAPPANPAENWQLPFETFDGDVLSLAEFQGRPVVVNFWASWCPACIAEMPDFEAVHQEFGDDVVFLGFAVEDRRSDSLRLAAETGVTYTLADDPGDFYRGFEGLAMPTTVFITPDGELSERWSGILNAEALRDRLDTLLEDGA